MLKFCSMHCINLGIDLWVAGSTIRMILSHPSVNIWHGHDENDRLSGAWDEFKRWTRSNRLKFPDIHWCPFYRDIIIASYRFNLNQRVWSGKNTYCAYHYDPYPEACSTTVLHCQVAKLAAPLSWASGKSMECNLAVHVESTLKCICKTLKWKWYSNSKITSKLFDR